MKFTFVLSVCTLALATAVAANHGQFEHNVAPHHTSGPANKPGHHCAAREAREHEVEHEHKPSHRHEAREATTASQSHHLHTRTHIGHHSHTHVTPAHTPTHPTYWVASDYRHPAANPTATQHHARNAAKPTGGPAHDSFKSEEKDEEEKSTRRWIRSLFKSDKKPEHGEEMKSHHHARPEEHKGEHKHAEEMESPHHARDAARNEEHKGEFKHTEEETNSHHHARDSARKEENKKASPRRAGGAIAGKPGHHFIRSAARPNFSSTNPFSSTRWTPKTAITSVRGILSGDSGIAHTCGRCVAAMQVGQSLAQQSSSEDFSKAVVGLCKQMKYKSDEGCASAFAMGKVGAYVSALKGADLGSDGEGFCRQYFGAC